MPRPLNYGVPRYHHSVTPDQQAKRDSRAEQGWDKKAPLTLRRINVGTPAFVGVAPSLTRTGRALVGLAQSRRPR